MPIKGILGGNGVKPLGFGLSTTAAAETTDPEFNQTVLLLHGDGSEGAGDTPNLGDPNYKAFKDNSASPLAIEVNGDAYGNDFSPYYYADGYWSNEFDGSDNIRFGGTSNESAFQFGTGEFTIEFFVQLQSATSSSEYGFFGCINGFYFQLYQGTLEYHTSSKDFDISYTPTNNAWVHFAISRDSSNNLRLWIDGTLTHTVASHTYNYSTIAGFQVMDIGTGYTGRRAKGYMSNFRVVKGSAVYSGTGSITVPTSPLTAISGTTLLACQSNRFLDNSTSNLSPTITGDPKVSTNTPFTITKTANVGSGFFGDGTTSSGDYLYATLASAIGTGDMTAEFWWYPTAFYDYIAPFSVNEPGTRANGFNIGSDANATLKMVDTGASNFISSSNTLTKFEWQHIAMVRSGSTVRMFRNGVQVGTISNSRNWSGTRIAVAVRADTVGETASGYIADCNLVVGTAKYDASGYTVPTSTVSADANTKFLTCQYSGAVRNVGFVDDSRYNHRVTRNGDVHMGTFSPFSLADGYWGRYSDSTTNSDTHGSGVTLGTNDFTIGMFVYPINSSGGTSGSTISSRTALYADTGAASVIIAHDQLLVAAPSTWTITINYTTDIVLNQWQWIQVDRTGSTFRVSIDGSYVDGGGATSSGSVPAINTGTFGERAGQADYTGYFSNFILINGANRGSITPPTTPLTANSDTALLLYQNNRLVNNGNTSVTLTSGGDNKTVPFSPIAPSRSYSKDAVGGSGYFDGSGDYLQLTDTNFGDFDFGTGPFLIEFWIYYTTLGTTVIGQTGWGNVLQRNSSSHVLQFYQAASSGTSGTYWITGTTALAVGQWYHVVVQRNDAGVLDLWVNGSRDATNSTYASTDMKFHSAKGDVTVAYWYGSVSAGVNYISNLRIKNSAVYTSGATITVPTAPFTADANTVFLLSGNNAGIIDHTMRNNLEIEGNTRISTIQKKFGTGSIYFDGTGDELRIPSSELFNFAGDFTIEFWIYKTESTTSGQYDGILYRSTDWRFKFQQSDNVINYDNGTDAQLINYTGSPAMLNNWHHIAFVRNGSTLTGYVDGTSYGSVTESGAFTATADLLIGENGTDHLGGYIDELRITKGVARYTGSSFTVPTKAFANR